jgi:hypothetical protein
METRITSTDRGMWQHVTLAGEALDAEVARVLNIPAGAYSTDWAVGGPLVDTNQVFIDPPHETHVHGGPQAGWHRHDYWSATVSARVRTYRPTTDRFASGLAGRGHVGRGVGATALQAAMRAIVASFGVVAP